MSFLWMASSEKEHERRRFYLLPGMGGRALRRKQRLIMRWSIVAGLLVSLILAALLYWINSSRTPVP
jgi:hypothetical protein